MDNELWIDTRWRGPTGIGRFTHEVTRRLAGWRDLPVRLRKLHPLDSLVVGGALRRRRPAAYFSPGFNPPLWPGVPFVFTIHDLIHLHVRDEARLKFRLHYQLVVLPAARRAERVLTVSDYSRRRILEWTGLPDDRVTVVGNGVAPEFCPTGVRHRHRRPYVVCVSNGFPHKNLPRLLAAFAASRARRDLDLVLVCTPPPALVAERGRLGLDQVVHFTGRVADGALPAIYRGATACVCPSLYEGFGLPAVEAMASGVPVAVSNVTSLPEVVGQAGLTFDARRTGAVADAIDKLVDDDALRARLAQLGQLRAQRFRWPEVAARVHTALRSVCDVALRAEVEARDVAA